MMRQPDWEKLTQLSSHPLNDSDVEEVYSVLIDYEPEEHELDGNKAIVLVKLAQAALYNKGMQVDVLMEELDRAADKTGKESVHQQKELLEENEQLRAELRKLRKGGSSRGYKDMGLHDEAVALERQVATLQRELREAERELATEKRDSENLVTKLRDAEREKKDLRREIEALKDEVADCRNNLDVQLDDWDSKLDHQQKLTATIHEKNQQISQLLEDIDMQEKENISLHSAAEELRDKLTAATDNINSMVSEYVSLKDSLQQSEDLVQELRKENSSLQIRIEDSNYQRKRREHDLDNINQVVDSSIDQWKKVLLQKDEEINGLRMKLAHVMTQASNLQLDTEQNSVIKLQKALEDRDKQIEHLQLQLAEATKELDSSAQLMKELQSQTIRPNHGHIGGTAVEIQRQIKESNEQVLQLKAMLVDAEKDACAKAEEVTRLVKQIREYEAGEYGLADAIGEIKECRQQIRVRDRQIEELTSQLNKLQNELDDHIEDNVILREKLGMDMNEVLDTTDFYAKKRQEKTMLLDLQKEVGKLKEQIINLRAENRILKKKTENESVASTSSVSQEIHEDLVPSHDIDLSKVVQLKAEVSALRKGLEEILYSIKEQDGKNDVKLECPALEQLLLAFDNHSLVGSHIPTLRLHVQVNTKESKIESHKEVFSDVPVPVVHESEPSSEPQTLHKEVIVIASVSSNGDPNHADGDVKDHPSYKHIKTQLKKLFKRFRKMEIKIAEDKLKWDKQYNDMLDEKNLLQMKVEQYEGHLAAIENNGSDIKKLAAEWSRRSTASKASETIMRRRLNRIEKDKEELISENTDLHDELLSVENNSLKRLSDLECFKERALQQITELQLSVEASVPLRKLEMSNQQYNYLALKYRDLLQRHGDLLTANSRLHELELELQKVREDHEVSKSTRTGSVDFEKLYKSAKDQTEYLIQQNSMLETQISEVTKMNAMLQETECDLRKQLVEVVTRELYEEIQARLKNAESAERLTREENIKLHEMYEIAQNQVEMLQKFKHWRTVDLISLEQQVLDVQSKSKDKAYIATLHSKISTLEKHKMLSSQKVEKLQRKLHKLEVTCVRQDQKRDEERRGVICFQNQVNIRCRCLYNVIQDLRRQYSGALPLYKQEQIVGLMDKLSLEKEQISVHLHTAESKLANAAAKLQETDLKQTLLDNMLKAVEGKNLQKQVLEWYRKNEELQLKELRSSRSAEQLSLKVTHLQNLVSKLEDHLATVEEENVRRQHEWEEQQLLWEQREVEIEKQMIEFSKEKDNTLIVEDLEVSSCKEEYEAKLKESKCKLQLLDEHLSEAQQKLIHMNQLIADKDAIINELRQQALSKSDQELLSLSHQQLLQTSDVARQSKAYEASLNSLKERLRQKEESITMYQTLLQEAKDELRKGHEEQVAQIQSFQSTIQSLRHANTQLKVNGTRPSVISVVSQESDCQEHTVQIQELSNELARAQASLSSSTNRVTNVQEEVDQWRRVANERQKEMEELRETMRAGHAVEIHKLQSVNRKQIGIISELRRDIAILQKEVELANDEASKQPSSVVKGVVEQLKKQLTQKEKQQQVMNQALDDLRKQLQNTMSETLKLQIPVRDIGDLISRPNDELVVQLEESQTKISWLEQQLQTSQSVESAAVARAKIATDESEKMKTDFDKLQEDNSKLSRQVSLLRTQLNKLRDGKNITTDIQQLQATKKTLQAELQNMEAQRVENESALKRAKSYEKIAKWEENKKWQRNVEKLEKQLKEKENEVARLTKQNNGFRDTLVRLEREKNLLDSKLKAKTASSTPVVPSHSVAVLQKENTSLQEKINLLQKQIGDKTSKAVDSLQVKNQLLQKRIESQERHIATLEVSRKGNATVASEMGILKKREEQFQKQLLHMEEEKLELKLELEQLKLSAPHLHDRIFELQRHVTALKSARASGKGDASILQAMQGDGHSISEVEKTIIALKNVVQKLESENTSLRQSHVEEHTFSGKLKTLQQSLESITAENKRLLTQVYKLEHERKASVLAFNEAMEKASKLEVELESMKGRATAAEKKLRDILCSRDHAAKDEMAERVKRLEEELERKSQLLTNVKLLLQKAAAKEKEHIEENETLKQQLQEYKS